MVNVQGLDQPFILVDYGLASDHNFSFIVLLKSKKAFVFLKDGIFGH